jgi:hypothetical protein
MQVAPLAGEVFSNGVYPARYTAANDREIIVFLIGMRFNGWRGIGQAALAFFRMPAMLAELARKPELGCLGGHVAFMWKNAYVMQYWDSYDALEQYAKARENAHLPAWRWYNKLGRSGRGAGIWHETFRVAAGAYESIYVNMPKFGLATATGHLPLRPGSASRERIGATAKIETAVTESAVAQGSTIPEGSTVAEDPAVA